MCKLKPTGFTVPFPYVSDVDETTGKDKLEFLACTNEQARTSLQILVAGISNFPLNSASKSDQFEFLRTFILIFAHSNDCKVFALR